MTFLEIGLENYQQEGVTYHKCQENFSKLLIDEKFTETMNNIAIKFGERHSISQDIYKKHYKKALNQLRTLRQRLNTTPDEEEKENREKMKFAIEQLEACPGTTPVVQDGGKRRNNSKRLSSQSGGTPCSGSVKGSDVVDGSEADSSGREIFDKLYVENVQKDYKLNPLPPHPIKNTSNTFKATEHNSSMNQILGLIKRWINDNNHEQKTQEFINHCQLNYQESKLFAIKNYPEQISKRNDWITFSIIKKLQKENDAAATSPSRTTRNN